MFKVESATVSAAQRIQIRKVLQKVGLTAKQGEELAYVPQFSVAGNDMNALFGAEATGLSAPSLSGPRSALRS